MNVVYIMLGTHRAANDQSPSIRREPSRAEESLARDRKYIAEMGRKPPAIYALVNKNTGEMKTWSTSKSSVVRDALRNGTRKTGA